MFIFPLQILFSHLPSTIGNISIFNHKIYFDLSFGILFMQHLLHLALILSNSSMLYMLSKNKGFPQYSLMLTMFFIDVSSFLFQIVCVCPCMCTRTCERERETVREIQAEFSFLHSLLNLLFLS